jgi:hypothetical protein
MTVLFQSFSYLYPRFWKCAADLRQCFDKKFDIDLKISAIINWKFPLNDIDFFCRNFILELITMIFDLFSKGSFTSPGFTDYLYNSIFLTKKTSA